MNKLILAGAALAAVFSVSAFAEETVTPAAPVGTTVVGVKCIMSAADKDKACTDAGGTLTAGNCMMATSDACTAAGGTVSE